MTAALTVIQPPPAPSAEAAAIRSGGSKIAVRLELAVHPLHDQVPVGNPQRHLPTLEHAHLSGDELALWTQMGRQNETILKITAWIRCVRCWSGTRQKGD
jgi:hypothetical protein